MKRYARKATCLLALFVSALFPASVARADAAWSDSGTFTLDMLCQNPSNSGRVWGDSFVFILSGGGDFNRDGSVDTGDVTAFINALLQGGGWTQEELCAGDLDEDQQIDGDDVQPFVDLLLSSA